MQQTEINNDQVLEATHVLNLYLIENGSGEERHTIFQIMNRVLNEIIESDE